MDEFEKSVVEKINLFKRATQITIETSADQYENTFVCPICGESAFVYCENGRNYAFCPNCGICAIRV